MRANKSNQHKTRDKLHNSHQSKVIAFNIENVMLIANVID